MIDYRDPYLLEDDGVFYPDSDDSRSVGESTKQYRFIKLIQSGLDALFAAQPDVFVAGNLFWYPVKGNNTIVRAPDVLVAFGPPKGDRFSYRQWNEGDVAPQVVFEILSRSNRPAEMTRKFAFYDRYGVEEYYIYDPEEGELTGWLRQDGTLSEIESLLGWVSPRLGVRFGLSGSDMELFTPEGENLLLYAAGLGRAEREHMLLGQAEQQRQRAELAEQQTEQERQRADQERQRVALLEALLRKRGIDPDAANSEETP